MASKYKKKKPTKYTYITCFLNNETLKQYQTGVALLSSPFLKGISTKFLP